MRLIALALVCASCGRSDAAATPSEAERARAERSFDAYRQPDALVAALGISDGAVVADVGAGHGYLTGRLAAAAGPHGRVVATEIDSQALAELAVRFAAPTGGAPVAVRAVHVDDPGLEPGTYDVVLLSQVDHLLDDRARFFRRLGSALAPGGRLAVTNRLPYREPVRAAARKAGLAEVSGPAPHLPGQFLLFFEVDR